MFSWAMVDGNLLENVILMVDNVETMFVLITQKCLRDLNNIVLIKEIGVNSLPQGLWPRSLKVEHFFVFVF